MKRRLLKLVDALRLCLIDWQSKQSRAELERLLDMRDDLAHLERIEHRRQVRLEERRNRVLRGQL